MIRAASVSDIPELISLGKMLHQESSYSRFPFVEEKASCLLESVIKGSGVVFVAERNNEIIGGLAGGLTELWFSYVDVAFDYSFFVKPGKRHGIVAMRLMVAFEEWAKAVGAAEIHMGITTNVNIESTSSLYETMGFTNMGPMFLKSLRGG